jgi:elongation factor Ts
MVKELRERTGAGMMECKRALVETGGDIEAGIEHLRKTGLAKADKKASRVAAEGKIVFAADDTGNKAVLVEVNCETDFVAMDKNFLGFAEDVAKKALETGATDMDSLMEQPANAGGSLDEARQTLIAKIGENVQVRRAVHMSSDNNIGVYIHGGRIGVLVDLEGGSVELAKDLAMHVAAANPDYVRVDDIPADFRDKEREIETAKAQDSGKPPEIIEKMVDGRLRKRFSEITLLGQQFVKDTDLTVEKLLKQNGAQVSGFQRMEVGEGIEKKEDNFADEVMAQVRGG